MHKAPKQSFSNSHSIAFWIITHLYQIIAAADIGLGHHEAAICKLRHTINVWHHHSAVSFNIFICVRNAEKLTAAASLNIPGSNIFFGDLSNEDQVYLLKGKYFAQLPTIDILINAAGIRIIKPVESLTAEKFQRALNANLVTPFLLLKAFLPAMKEVKKGLIINIPGVLDKVPMVGAAAYSASKYGLTGMMQSIREELKRTEIRITNIFLGGTDSAF